MATITNNAFAQDGNGLGPRTQIINIAKTNTTKVEFQTMVKSIEMLGYTVAGVDGWTADEQADNIKVAVQGGPSFVADGTDALGVTGAATTVLADFDQEKSA